jgi:hypothetical protein
MNSQLVDVEDRLINEFEEISIENSLSELIRAQVDLIFYLFDTKIEHGKLLFFIINKFG